MNLYITKIELVEGSTLKQHWKEPMFVVNDKYLASSINEHNHHDWKFDLQVGETADVVISGAWIARSNEGSTND